MIANPKEKTIKVVRSFCMEGEPVPVGEILTLPYGTACELIGSNKAVAAVAPKPAEAVVVQKEVPAVEAKPLEQTITRPSRRGNKS